MTAVDLDSKHALEPPTRRIATRRSPPLDPEKSVRAIVEKGVGGQLAPVKRFNEISDKSPSRSKTTKIAPATER